MAKLRYNNQREMRHFLTVIEVALKNYVQQKMYYVENAFW